MNRMLRFADARGQRCGPAGVYVAFGVSRDASHATEDVIGKGT